MSAWKIIGEKASSFDVADAICLTIVSAPFKLLSGILPTIEPPNKIYTVEEVQTGEIRAVCGHDKTEAGNNIIRGYFVDDE